MNTITRFIILLIFMTAEVLSAQTSKHRLIILADMGNEADEMQQMVHMMMYSNEFDLEGLIAVTGKYLNPSRKSPYRQVLHPELFSEIIDEYAKVRDKLMMHAKGWPEVDYLHSIVVKGQTGYGIQDTGKGKHSKGSDLILQSLTKDDARPVYIVVNAGSNTLAQALIDFEASHSKDELASLLAKIRVFENGAQDNAGAWICAKYPEIHWIRSNYQTYCYGGPKLPVEKEEEGDVNRYGPYTWEPYEYSSVGQHQWTLAHIKADHGFIGRVYPLRQFGSGKLGPLEGGGTIPWLGLIHQGLSDINNPHWGGWSGRYTEEKIKNAWSRHESVKVDEEKYGQFALFIDIADKWIDAETNIEYDNKYAPVWRWRRAYFNDFQCRMDWCVNEYENANHPPIAAVNGDKKEKIYFLKAKAGQDIKVDASASTDPDNDLLEFNWWIYKEAGTYMGEISMTNAQDSTIVLQTPKDASGKTFHLILEINDTNSIASMYDYRRIVIEVAK